MKVYGTEILETEFTVTYGGRKFAIVGCECATCEYVFFFPAVSEHEPRMCPNCGIKFISCSPEGTR